MLKSFRVAFAYRHFSSCQPYPSKTSQIYVNINVQQLTHNIKLTYNNQ